MPLPRTANEPLTAGEDEREELNRAATLARREDALSLVGPDGDVVPLPPLLRLVLRDAGAALAAGRSVSLIRHGELLTTQEAANILHVSRPYLIGLLEQGVIPYSKVGTHRRLRFEDVMAYKRSRDAQRAEALRELTRLSGKLGLYDVDYSFVLEEPADDPVPGE